MDVQRAFGSFNTVGRGPRRAGPVARQSGEASCGTVQYEGSGSSLPGNGNGGSRVAVIAVAALVVLLFLARR